MSKRKTNFTESIQGNVYSYTQYIDRLTSLAISMFEWKGLPDSVDPRYLEMTLFLNGSAVYFNDDEIGNLLCIKKTRICNLTKQMRELGLIVVDGRGKNKKYLLK